MSPAEPGSDEDPTTAELTRWLSRERRARAAAEQIAERVTGELYAMSERQVSTHRTLQAFVAMSSHDLRTPVASILGAAHLLIASGERLTEQQRLTLLGGVARAAKQLQRLVDDLFIMSTIEAGELRAKPEAVSLTSAVAAMHASLPERGEEVVIQTVPDVVVWCDPDHLQRILVNYATNALKYGEAPVLIDGTEVDGCVELRVRDHGPGVPADFVPRLFDEFARADDTASAIRGTGLGLAIVRNLAEVNDGDAWYEPANPGACFVLRIRTATEGELTQD